MAPGMQSHSWMNALKMLAVPLCKPRLLLSRPCVLLSINGNCRRANAAKCCSLTGVESTCLMTSMCGWPPRALGMKRLCPRRRDRMVRRNASTSPLMILPGHFCCITTMISACGLTHGWKQFGCTTLAGTGKVSPGTRHLEALCLMSATAGLLAAGYWLGSLRLRDQSLTLSQRLVYT